MTRHKDVIPTSWPWHGQVKVTEINVIDHLKYGGKHGIVRWHTAKKFHGRNQRHDQSNTNSPKISPAPHQCHPNLHPTMQPHTCSPQLSKPKVMKNKKSEESDDNNIKRDHDIYDKLDETQDFKVADGIVFFTRTFRYLGSLISYNLRNKEDIKARIAAANASICALKEIWSNPHLDTYNWRRAILVVKSIWLICEEAYCRSLVWCRTGKIVLGNVRSRAFAVWPKS